MREREVVISVSHVSIEAASVDRALAAGGPEASSPEAAAARLRAKYPGKKIVVGLDVCQVMMMMTCNLLVSLGMMMTMMVIVTCYLMRC